MDNEMSLIEKLDGVLVVARGIKVGPFGVLQLTREKGEALAMFLRDQGPAIRQAMIDAERYAWLRKFSDNGGAVRPMVPTLTWAGPYTEGWHADLDAAIDKARATGEGEGHE